MRSDLEALVPRDKHDMDAVHAAVAAGWPAVRPIISELLEWVQDINWPVARHLAIFFAAIGAPLAPHIRSIFESDDGTWKYNVIYHLIARSVELGRELEPDLERLATHPTPRDREEEVDQAAIEILDALRAPLTPARA